MTLEIEIVTDELFNDKQSPVLKVREHADQLVRHDQLVGEVQANGYRGQLVQACLLSAVSTTSLANAPVKFESTFQG